jgi:hypothetical protein
MLGQCPLRPVSSYYSWPSGRCSIGTTSQQEATSAVGPICGFIVGLTGGSIPSSRAAIDIRGLPARLVLFLSLAPFVPLPVNLVIPFHAPLAARIHSLYIDIVARDTYTLSPVYTIHPRPPPLDRLEVLAAEEQTWSITTTRLLDPTAYERYQLAYATST